jgi:hypothetical protein
MEEIIMRCRICGAEVEHPEYGDRCDKCTYEQDWEGL